MAENLLSRIMRRAGVAQPNVLPQSRRLTESLAPGFEVARRFEAQDSKEPLSAVARALYQGTDPDQALAQVEDARQARQSIQELRDPTRIQRQIAQGASDLGRDIMTDPATYAGLIGGPAGAVTARLLGQGAKAAKWAASAGLGAELMASAGDANASATGSMLKPISAVNRLLMQRSRPNWDPAAPLPANTLMFQPGYIQRPSTANLARAQSAKQLAEQMERVRALQLRIPENFSKMGVDKPSFEKIRQDHLPSTRRIQELFDLGYRSPGLMRTADREELDSLHYPGIHFTVTDLDLAGRTREDAAYQQMPFLKDSDTSVPRRYVARSDVYKDLPVFSDDDVNTPRRLFSISDASGYPYNDYGIVERYRRMFPTADAAHSYYRHKLWDDLSARRFQRTPYSGIMYPNVVEGVDGNILDNYAFLQDATESQLDNFYRQNSSSASREEAERIGYYGGAQSVYHPRAIYNPSFVTTRPIGDNIVRYAKGGFVKKAADQALRRAAKSSGTNPPTILSGLTSTRDYRQILDDQIREGAVVMQAEALSRGPKYRPGQYVFTKHTASKNQPPYEVLAPKMLGGRVQRMPDGSVVREPGRLGYRIRQTLGPDDVIETDIFEDGILGVVDPTQGYASGGLIKKAVRRAATPNREELKRTASDFLRGWSYDSGFYRANPKSPKTVSGFAAAAKLYPFTARKPVYRGLSFDDEVTRRKVIEDLRSGRYRDDALSSWTIDPEQASTYALLDGAYGDSSIPGFVIETRLPKTVRAVDTGKASDLDIDFETIVDSGEYPIRIVQGEGYASGGLVKAGKGFPLRTAPKSVDRIRQILEQHRGPVSAEQLRRTLANQVGLPAIEAWTPRIFKAPGDRIIVPSTPRLVQPPPLRMMDLRPTPEEAGELGDYTIEEIEDTAFGNLVWDLEEEALSNPTEFIHRNYDLLVDRFGVDPNDLSIYAHELINTPPGGRQAVLDDMVSSFNPDPFAVRARPVSPNDVFVALAGAHRQAETPVWRTQVETTTNYAQTGFDPHADQTMVGRNSGEEVPYRFEHVQRLRNPGEEEVYSESGLAIPNTSERIRKRFPSTMHVYGGTHYAPVGNAIAAHVRGTMVPSYYHPAVLGREGSNVFEVEELQSDVPEYMRGNPSPGSMPSVADRQLMKRPHAMMAAGVLEAAARNPDVTMVTFPSADDIMTVRPHSLAPFYRKVYDEEVPEYVDRVRDFFGAARADRRSYPRFDLQDPEVRQHIIDKGLPGYAEGGTVKPQPLKGEPLRRQLLPLQREQEQTNGLPAGILDATARYESGYDPTALGPKTRQGRAQGLYQFMPPTARQLGVNPFDPFAATNAAAAYQRYLLSRFNDPYAALIAWNWGEGNVARKGVERAPRESRDFAGRVMRRIQQLNSRPPTVATAPSVQLPVAEPETVVETQQPVAEPVDFLGSPGTSRSSGLGGFSAPTPVPAAQFSQSPDATNYLQQLMRLIDDPTLAPATVATMQNQGAG